jgi:hypothetical protein
MTDNEAMRIEIARCPWDMTKFQCREGDITGSTNSSNLTLSELKDEILFLIDMKYTQKPEIVK